jgi:hypothetical protein
LEKTYIFTPALRVSSSNEVHLLFFFFGCLTCGKFSIESSHCKNKEITIVPIPNRIKSKTKYKLSEHHNNQKNPPIQETLNHLNDKKKKNTTL